MKNKTLTALSVVFLTATAHGSYADPAISTSDIKTEADYRNALIVPGTLSLKESKLAEDKASNAKVKEFAGFEVEEQTAIGKILKENNTPEPTMSAEDQATLDILKKAAKGQEFDRAYVQAQIDGHKKLKAITESYLRNADSSSTDPKEMEARHLAMLSDTTIKQHIANTKELSAMFK